MKQNDFKKMKEQLNPTDEMVNDTYQKVVNQKLRPKKRFAFSRLAIVMSVFLVIGMVYLIRPVNQADQPNEPQYTGLEINPFIIQDHLMIDFISIRSLESLEEYAKYDENTMIVLAKVIKIEELCIEGDSPENHLIITSEVLESVQGELQSKEIVVSSILLDYFKAEIKDELFREGGIYLIPFSEFNHQYYLQNEFYTIFEVDPWGNVFSHSNVEAFQYYDGKPIETLIEDIKDL